MKTLFSSVLIVGTFFAAVTQASSHAIELISCKGLQPENGTFELFQVPSAFISNHSVDYPGVTIDVGSEILHQGNDLATEVPIDLGDSIELTYYPSQLPTDTQFKSHVFLDKSLLKIGQSGNVKVDIYLDTYNEANPVRHYVGTANCTSTATTELGF